MLNRYWSPDSYRTLVCVDSYEQEIPEGRMFDAYMEEDSFCSLTQFLLKMEERLNQYQKPQAYTTPRTFGPMPAPGEEPAKPLRIRRGNCGTFEVKIRFRQHTSWQGVIEWKEQGREQSFRSALELVMLMDSALRRADHGLLSWNCSDTEHLSKTGRVV